MANNLSIWTPFLVCFIIALPLFFTGCSEIEGTCLSYKVDRGMITNQNVFPDMCRKCVSYDSHNKCTNYNQVVCYDARIKTDLKTSSNTCTVEIVSNSQDMNYINFQFSKYYVGRVIKLRVPHTNNKVLNTCYLYSSLNEAMTYTSLVFFALSGVFFFVGLYYQFVKSVNSVNNQTKVYPGEPVPQNVQVIVQQPPILPPQQQPVMQQQPIMLQPVMQQHQQQIGYPIVGVQQPMYVQQQVPFQNGIQMVQPGNNILQPGINNSQQPIQRPLIYSQ